MGQAKNKKLSGDILSKNYLEGIALDAFENGEITSLPESDKDLYESLKNLYEQKHRNIVDYLKWYRETNIKKAHGETIHKQVAKHFNQLPEPKAFGEFHEYNKFLIQEVSKVYESAVFKRALDNKIQKLYNQSYENPKPTIKAIFVPQYQSSMVRLNDILGFDAPGEKSQINKYEFKYSNKTINEQDFIKTTYLIIRFLNTGDIENQHDDDDIELRMLLQAMCSFFLKDHILEMGELEIESCRIMPYSVAIIHTINPEGVPKDFVDIIAYKENDLYKDCENESEINDLLNDKSNDFFYNIFPHPNPILERRVKSELFTNPKSFLANFLSALDNYIARNNGYVLQKQKILDTQTKIENELKINDFVLSSFSEILEYRQSISYEGKYDPKLAQELDELIRTRYQEMADIGIILFEQNNNIGNIEILQELESGFDVKLLTKNGKIEANLYGKVVIEYLENKKLLLGHEKILSIEELPGISFNRESQKAYERLQRSNQNAIANKITELLEAVSQHGNPGKFVEEVASNSQKGYGWHLGKDGFKNCYLFDIGSAVRLVMDSNGVVRYIGDYHADKTAEIRVSKQLKLSVA